MDVAEGENVKTFLIITGILMMFVGAWGLAIDSLEVMRTSFLIIIFCIVYGGWKYENN